MANAFLNAKEYANVMLLLLKNNLVMGKLVDGRFNNAVTDQNGLTINVKRPPQFIAKDGPTLAEQSIVVGSTDLAVDRYRNVHISVSDLEAVQSWEALTRNATMMAAASTLAHDVDLFLHTQLLSFASHVGTPGETLKKASEFFPVHTRLMEQSVPDDGNLAAVLSYADGEAIRSSLVEGNIAGVNRIALEQARVPVMSTVRPYATQHIKSLTTGTRAATGAGLVAGAGQNVNYKDVKDEDSSPLSIDGLAAGATVKKGEIFTIAGVFAINNRSGETLPHLRQFVVTEDATADGTGAVELQVWPHIIVPGTGVAEADTNTAFGTVNAAPADNAALTFLGAAGAVIPVRAAWHKMAIQLVSAQLEKPASDTSSFARDEETGISIRYWRGSDITTGKHIHRWDMIYGAKVVDPRLGVRFSGQPA